MKFFLFILLGIVILLLMVVIHEFGHYIAGKILKFKIDEFSVGFGPKLFQKKNKKNGEKFTLRLVPLGGFCAFAGEDNADGTTIGKREDLASNTDSVQQQSESRQKDETTKRDYLLFDEQKPWKRIIVFIAGPLCNFLSAIIFSFIFILAVGYAHPVVTGVFVSPDDGTPYNQLLVGDEIVAVNGKDIGVMKSYNDLLGVPALGENVEITVLRNGEKIVRNITVKKIIHESENGETSEYNGFGFELRSTYKGESFGKSLLYCVPMTFKFSWMILGTFGQLLTGKIKFTALTGPIGTVSAFASVASQNWLNILIWLPLIASNLAIFNILPIPALDGSKVVFTVIEWIRGKPVNKKVENIIHFAGLVFLFGLVIVVDIIGMFVRGF
ncbi:MAG: hypothetical protein HFE48_06785 [Clostridia bacterium]|nr:hypothetical protein [Clostridia bacterium]